MKSIFIFFLLIQIKQVFNFKLCVVGGSSGLGRELIYQELENNNKILALTNHSHNIKVPYRGGGLKNKKIIDPIKDKNLYIDKYENYNKYNFDNIIFCTGAQPFEKDYSDKITKDILDNYKNELKNIILISAEGVGDSLPESNLGIKIMNNWYLQDSYRAKNKQEIYLKEYNEKFYNSNIIIIRPKAFSYGNNIYSIKSREKQASEILDLF